MESKTLTIPHSRRSLLAALKARLERWRKKRMDTGWVGRYPDTSWVRFDSYPLAEEDEKKAKKE